MKRLFLTTALCAFAFPSLADDIVIRADLEAATVYGSGADVTRLGTANLPAGRHRLLIAVPDLNAADLPQLTGPEGLRFGPPEMVFNHPLAEGALDNEAQAAARVALEVAEDALQAAQDALTTTDARIRAIEAQQAYLAAAVRGGENGVALPEDPALVEQFLSTLGTETARLAEELLEAQAARRDLDEAAGDARRAVPEALQALNATRPFGEQISVLAFDVNVPEAMEAEIALTYFTGQAGWSPSYELNLDTEAGEIGVDRFVTLYTYGAAHWQDVAVTFSTAAPDRAREPSEVASRPARLIEQAADLDARGIAGLLSPSVVPTAVPLGVAAEAAYAPVIVEPVVTAEFDGLSVSYPFSEPVSVGASGEVLLEFDTLTLEAEQENRAVPRWDDTAFLVAMTDNDTGEPILPGEARLYRDGALLGEGYLPLIAAGAEAEMAFGALDHLQLVWIDRSLAEGDRGIFTTSTTQERELAFGVENTSEEAATVRIMYATPFAEQEDLELDLDLSPAPTERDVDDARGVHAWEIEVDGGETELVEMGVSFEFPEGQVLDWQP